MRKDTEAKEETIRRQIDELEALRPSVEATGHDVTRYVYSRPRAMLTASTGWWLLAALVDTICVICGVIPGGLYVVILLLVVAVPFATCGRDVMSESTSVVANQETVQMLKSDLSRCKRLIEEFEQQRQQAEIYRPKFDSLQPIITQELRGRYTPHTRKDQTFMVEIYLRGYPTEDYHLDEKDYAKLLFRIAESRFARGDSAIMQNFIQNCENDLKLKVEGAPI